MNDLVHFNCPAQCSHKTAFKLTVKPNAMTEARVCDNGVTVSGQDGDSHVDRHNYVKDQALSICQGQGRVSSITIDLSYISYPFNVSSPITAH